MATATQPVSDAEWQALYTAAKDYFDEKPWEWMDDDQLFGVYDKDTDTVGYCCIMGALGEVLGLCFLFIDTTSPGS